MNLSCSRECQPIRFLRVYIPNEDNKNRFRVESLGLLNFPFQSYFTFTYYGCYHVVCTWCHAIKEGKVGYMPSNFGRYSCELSWRWNAHVHCNVSCFETRHHFWQTVLQKLWSLQHCEGHAAKCRLRHQFFDQINITNSIKSKKVLPRYCRIQQIWL